MKVVKPVTIVEANLYSSNAVEAYPEYNPATSYNVGDRVTYTPLRTVWEHVATTHGGAEVTPGTDITHWVEVGPMSKWAMFDNQISTSSIGGASLTWVLKAGYINSLALFNVVGNTLTATLRDGVAGPVVWSKTLSLDGTIISDWYQYFFEPAVALTDLVFTGIPPYLNGYLTITISGVGSTSVGYCIVGTAYDLGDTQYGAKTAITDYSKKNTSSTGLTTFEVGKYSKRISANVMLPNAQINKVQQVLTSLRAIPCAWVGVDIEGYEVLNVFGYYKDFSIDITYFDTSYCSLEIEGLT